MQSVGGSGFAAELSSTFPAYLSQLIPFLLLQKPLYYYCNYLFLWC